MAVDSINAGEPVCVVVDRVLRLYEQSAPGASTGSSGGNGSNGGSGANGSSMTGKMYGKLNHKGKLVGKGVVQSIHTAYAPDVCSLKYPPTSNSDAYYKCRKKKDKAESSLDEVQMPLKRFVLINFNYQSRKLMKLLDLFPFKVETANKLLKSLGLHKIAEAKAVFENLRGRKGFGLLIITKSRNAVKKVVNTLHDYIKDKKLGSDYAGLTVAELQGHEKLLSNRFALTKNQIEKEWEEDITWGYVREI
jgi:hypothetical protein